MNKSFHEHELDPSVRDALVWMLSDEPSIEEQESALNRIKRRDGLQPLGSSPTSSQQNPWTLPRVELAAACGIAVVISLVASTDAWAQVTHDYSSPLNEPRPIGSGSESTPAAMQNRPAAGWGVRVLLLSHVVSLLIGLLAMASSWCIALGKFFLNVGKRDSVRNEDRSVELRSLMTGLLLYGAGVFLGSIWSQLTWGSPWRWDPKEVFCLLSIAVGLLWLVGGRFASFGGNDSEQAKHVSLATIAFGTIFLMVPIASQFDALRQTHTYRFAPAFTTILTIVLSFFSVCLAVIWLTRLFRTRRRGNAASAG